MKRIFTLFVCICLSFLCRAQWSDTTNKFTDSLHMQVTSALKNQENPIVLRSYPDGGYFVIWEDHRNDPTSYDDVAAIYAQKYSKTGVALWAANGVPVGVSANNQHYTTGSSEYRNHSLAATDSAGGFYMAYADDSVSSYTYQRACVQHIKSDGTAVFAGPGHIVSSSTSANFNISPQLIADGSGGFFYSFGGAASIVGSFVNLFAYDYKDINGTLQFYGGGQVNENATQSIQSSTCGNYSTVSYTAAEVQDYQILPDLQGGCNVVMALSINDGHGLRFGYNKLFRAKTNAVATEHYLDENYADSPYVETYQQGNVYRLYYVRTDRQRISCGDGSGGIVVVTQIRLVQNGFQTLDEGDNVYSLADPKGVTVSTTGNINATLLATQERSYSQTTGVSKAIVKGYVVKEEVYDSIPYQRASSNDALYPGYNTTEPATLSKLNNFQDTILPSPYNYDFCLSGGANQIYAACVQDSAGLVRLQHLAVEAQTADSFAVVYKTDSVKGAIIGKGSYGNPPQIAVNQNGNALFYIKEYDGSTGPVRVSPVLSGAQLAWGAMGESVGTGYWNGSYYDMSAPFVSLDPVDGTALIAWTDTRNNGTTGYDIYMRHLDDLNNTAYEPPYTRVKPVNNPYGPPTSSAVLYGTTNALTTISVFDGSYTPEPGVSPVVAISDNYNLGTVTVKTYDNTGGIRTSADGKPYLDRSYTITPDNNPNGAATITMRLFFTTAEFAALQAADTSIKTPGDLAVVKQPSGSGSGSTYTVVPGEATIPVQSWAAVDGGYYIEIQISSFSNFFIFKNLNAALPLTWLGITAERANANTAIITWRVGSETNVKNYTVQYSTDGITYKDGCTVSAANIGSYHCTLTVSSDKKYYFQVKETDVDGRHMNSQTVWIDKLAQVMKFVVSPNPAHADATLVYNLPVAAKATLKLMTNAGVAVWQETTTLSASGTVQMPMNRLPAGAYSLQIILPNETRLLKVVKE